MGRKHKFGIKMCLEKKNKRIKNERMDRMKKQAMKCLAALLLLGLVMGGCTTQSNSKNQQDSAPQQSVEQNKAAGEERSEAGISHEEALQISCTEAGTERSAVEDFSVELNKEKGRLIYEVEIVVGEHEYEYELDGNDGAVLEQKQTNYLRSAAEQQAKIPYGEAVAAALQHAQLKAEDAQVWKQHLTEDDGAAVYEIELMTEEHHYEYEISGSTGQVLESEQKRR